MGLGVAEVLQPWLPFPAVVLPDAVHGMVLGTVLYGIQALL